MSKRLIALLAAVAAIGMIAAGCGGGGSDASSETSATIGKAEFLKKGNAICAKGNEEIDEAFESFAKKNNLSEKKAPSGAELKDFSEETLVPTAHRQLKEIQALGLPKGAEQEAKAVFAAVEEALGELEADPSVLTKEGQDPFAKANKLSRELGLTKCGEE